VQFSGWTPFRASLDVLVNITPRIMGRFAGRFSISAAEGRTFQAIVDTCWVYRRGFTQRVPAIPVIRKIKLKKRVPTIFFGPGVVAGPVAAFAYAANTHKINAGPSGPLGGAFTSEALAQMSRNRSSGVKVSL